MTTELFLSHPPRRGIIPLNELQVSRRLARTIRSGWFSTKVDCAFNSVIEACAAPRPGRPETWDKSNYPDPVLRAS